MSDDLIKRSAAIKDLCDISNNSDMPNDWHRGLSVAISALYRVSSADRPQGHYIKGKNGEYYCSNCKRIDDKYSVARFCWWCGARMKGADDE